MKKVWVRFLSWNKHKKLPPIGNVIRFSYLLFTWRKQHLHKLNKFYAKKTTSKEQSKTQLNKCAASSQTLQTLCSLTLKPHAVLTSHSYFQHTCGHSSIWLPSDVHTHHWLRWLGVSWVLLLLGCRRGGGIRRLGLGGGWAAVWHGQLSQVGGVCGKNWGPLATVQASFSWKRQTQRILLSHLSFSL